jgi:hypothetical protein
MCEMVLKPESKILMWQLDRILGTDPQLNGEMEMTPPGMLERPELSPEERRREAVEFYNLLRGALKVFEDLDQPINSTACCIAI